MSPSTRRRALAALALLAASTAPACAGQEQDGRDTTGAREVAREAAVPSPTPAEKVDPDDFVRRITNLYMPLEPGTTLTYEGTGGDGRERAVVEVTRQTRTILGVTATVVRDRVYREGELIEDTRDWFAQDRQGNVWYFGEDSRDIRYGEVVSREGSWEAGRDGASPGIVMPGDPQPGDTYSQENAPGVAEDRGEVLSLVATADVPQGSYENVLKTRDTTPLEPKVVEHKFYARGVGLVAEEEAGAGGERLELVRLERP
ncbi:hypothetical protein [Streptomyces sp. 6N223]|uniref:hypothetical protein n=1 Tax=Streptomyces sp. 6N223 TaxID=3457412 RepID=UPI003FD55181